VLNSSFSENYHTNGNSADKRATIYLPEQIFSICGWAVILENDNDFGQLPVVENLPSAVVQNEPLPSQQIDVRTLSHLSNRQQKQLLSLIDKFACSFTQIPGLCSLIMHTMQMSPEFKPKRLRAYRVPEKQKPALSAEIQKLLKLGFIERIDSP
jgi:hypothetical protein